MGFSRQEYWSGLPLLFPKQKDYYSPIIKIKKTLEKEGKSDFQNHIRIFKCPIFNKNKQNTFKDMGMHGHPKEQMKQN